MQSLSWDEYLIGADGGHSLDMILLSYINLFLRSLPALLARDALQRLHGREVGKFMTGDND